MLKLSNLCLTALALLKSLGIDPVGQVGLVLQRPA